MAHLQAALGLSQIEPPPTTPSAEPAKEAEEEACHSPELTYDDVHGQLLGPVFLAQGRALALAARLDPTNVALRQRRDRHQSATELDG